MTLPIVLLHGSHGKGFVHKAVVAALLLVSDLVVLASCGEAALAPGLSDMTVIVVGSAAAHVIELSLRHSYAEQVQERLRVAEVTQLMEEERGVGLGVGLGVRGRARGWSPRRPGDMGEIWGDTGEI